MKGLSHKRKTVKEIVIKIETPTTPIEQAESCYLSAAVPFESVLTNNIEMTVQPDS